MPFEKGKSGNPSGKSKVPNHASYLSRPHAEKAILVLVNALADKDKKIAISAANSLLDRGFGRPKEMLELTGEDGGPITTTRIPATTEWIESVLRRGEKETPPVSSEN